MHSEFVFEICQLFHLFPNGLTDQVKGLFVPNTYKQTAEQTDVSFLLILTLNSLESVNLCNAPKRPTDCLEPGGL